MRSGSAMMASLVAMSLVIAACGGDDDADDVGSPTPATDSSDEQTSSEPPAAEPSDESEPTADDTTTEETPDDETGVSADCPADRQGGSLTMGVFSEPPGLDPIRTNASASTGGTEVLAIYDALLRFDAATGTYEPRVAESVEPSADFSVWTVKVRPGVTFGNGDPLTANDVKYSFERFGGEDVTVPLKSLTALASEVNVIDDLTVEFVLTDPWANFPNLLANSPGMVVNQNVVDERGDDFALNPIGAGAGPFELVDFVPGEGIRLVAKEDYWGGRPCIDELEFITIPNSSANYETFQNGETDVTFLRDPETLARAVEDGVSSLTELSDVSDNLLLNSGVRGSEAPTTDVRVRKAINHAVNIEQVNERAFGGTATMSSALYTSASRFYQEGVEPLPYDTDLAASLVEEVKAETGWDGSLRLTCEQDREELAIALKAQLDAVGFAVELDMVPAISDLIQKVIVDADYETSCFGANLLDSDPWPGLRNNWVTTSSSNFAGYSNPEYDALIDELRITPDFESQLDIMARIQNVWNEDPPTLALTATPQTTLYDDDVDGLVITANALIMLNEAYFID